MHFMSPIKFHVATKISCRRENDFMSPQKFHVAEKMISCRRKNFMSRGKMISCRENDLMSPKLISCRQKCFSCRRKVDFMSPKKFHVGKKVDFSDASLQKNKKKNR